MGMSINRFNIDFFEFCFLAEACIPPQPIARISFWKDIINKYYKVLSQDERDKLFSWMNRNHRFEDSLNNKNEDCLLFNDRYDKFNQYNVTTLYLGEIKVVEAFKWQDKYHINESSSVEPKYIIRILPSYIK